MEFVVSDDHPGLKRAAAEVLPEAAWPALTLGCPASRVAGSARRAVLCEKKHCRF